MTSILQTVFAAELIAPSTTLWLVSAWVSDIPILDNRGREFNALEPEWPPAYISLVDTFAALSRFGCRVVVVANDDSHNDRFELQVTEACPGISIYRSETLHKKGLLGDGFVLDGSMNYTFRGTANNDEQLIFRTDPAIIAARRLEYADNWPVR